MCLCIPQKRGCHFVLSWLLPFCLLPAVNFVLVCPRGHVSTFGHLNIYTAELPICGAYGIFYTVLAMLDLCPPQADLLHIGSTLQRNLYTISLWQTICYQHYYAV